MDSGGYVSGAYLPKAMIGQKGGHLVGCTTLPQRSKKQDCRLHNTKCTMADREKKHRPPLVSNLCIGPFSHEQWKEISCIHFILPNMSEHGQACMGMNSKGPSFPNSTCENAEQSPFFQGGWWHNQIQCIPSTQELFQQVLALGESWL
jgi:hypothetical protein